MLVFWTYVSPQLLPPCSPTLPPHKLYQFKNALYIYHPSRTAHKYNPELTTPSRLLLWTIKALSISISVTCSGHRVVKGHRSEGCETGRKIQSETRRKCNISLWQWGSLEGVIFFQVFTTAIHSTSTGDTLPSFQATCMCIPLCAHTNFYYIGADVPS